MSLDSELLNIKYRMLCCLFSNVNSFRVKEWDQKMRKRWFEWSEAQKENEQFSKRLAPTLDRAAVWWKPTGRITVCRQRRTCSVSRHTHVTSQARWLLQHSASVSTAAPHTSRPVRRNVTVLSCDVLCTARSNCCLHSTDNIGSKGQVHKGTASRWQDLCVK